MFETGWIVSHGVPALVLGLGSAFLCWAAGCGFGATESWIVRVAMSEPARARALAVCRRRADIENAFGSGLGVALAVTAFAYAVFLAIPSTHVALAYSGVCFDMAILYAVAFLRLRRTAARRVASLAPRRQTAAAPSLAWALASIAAVLPLAYLGFEPVAAVVCSAAACATLELARRVALMPALISDGDAEAELFVDAYMRTVRTSILLGLAMMQTFLFAMTANSELVAGTVARPERIVAGFATLLIAIAFACFSVMRTRWLQPILQSPSGAKFRYAK